MKTISDLLIQYKDYLRECETQQKQYKQAWLGATATSYGVPINIYKQLIQELTVLEEVESSLMARVRKANDIGRDYVILEGRMTRMLHNFQKVWYIKDKVAVVEKFIKDLWLQNTLAD